MDFGHGARLPAAGLGGQVAGRRLGGSAWSFAGVRVAPRRVRAAVWISARPWARITAMGKTALIVDDHPSFRASARRMLEADGYAVIGEAKDGGAALAATRRLRPDLVLLDVRLPDIDGFEVARRMLLNAEDRASQIVLTSSQDPSDLREAIGASGARGFIPKGELTGAALSALLG